MVRKPCGWAGGRCSKRSSMAVVSERTWCRVEIVMIAFFYLINWIHRCDVVSS